jgi:hypothetical protein
MNTDASRPRLQGQNTEFAEGFLRAFGAQAINLVRHRTVLPMNST